MNTKRTKNTRLSLEGLSIGDALGQQFFIPGVVEQADQNNLPPSPWNYTEMAMAIVQILEQRETIDQDLLAEKFAQRYELNPWRGYGAGAMSLLRDINNGVHWKDASKNLFGGSGSYGNGGAMRAAPLGAWFADNVQETIRQATLSAEITHSHKEGIVGTIAVALAAGWALRRFQNQKKESPNEMIPWILEHLEPSEVRKRLEFVSTFPMDGPLRLLLMSAAVSKSALRTRSHFAFGSPLQTSTISARQCGSPQESEETLTQTAQSWAASFH